MVVKFRTITHLGRTIFFVIRGKHSVRYYWPFLIEIKAVVYRLFMSFHSTKILLYQFKKIDYGPRIRCRHTIVAFFQMPIPLKVMSNDNNITETNFVISLWHNYLPLRCFWEALHYRKNGFFLFTLNISRLWPDVIILYHVCTTW